jgi:hypothetical protein
MRAKFSENLNDRKRGKVWLNMAVMGLHCGDPIPRLY